MIEVTKERLLKIEIKGEQIDMFINVLKVISEDEQCSGFKKRLHPDEREMIDELYDSLK